MAMFQITLWKMMKKKTEGGAGRELSGMSLMSWTIITRWEKKQQI